MDEDEGRGPWERLYSDDQPRDDAGRWSDGGGGASLASDAKMIAIANEPTTPVPVGKRTTASEPTERASRVGVAGDEIPPPPPVPCLPNLTPDERQVEGDFVSAYEADPDGMAQRLIEEMAAGRIGDAPNVFSTDESKMLNPAWKGTVDENGKLSEETKDFRARYNTMLQQTANALAKRAFLAYLDEKVKDLPEDQRSILVTSGGVAAGKGFALENIPEAKGAASMAAAVWDAAGEQNGTENDWILKEATARGITVTYAYVNADPVETWENEKRGVIERAEKKGRMVDARAYADSYAYGATNFQSFQERNKDNPLAKFLIIDNRGTPKLVSSIPKEAFSLSSSTIYNRALRAVNAKGTKVRASIRRGAAAGLRIWPGGSSHSFAPAREGPSGRSGPGGGRAREGRPGVGHAGSQAAQAQGGRLHRVEAQEFNPDQPRDKDGKWSDGGGGGVAALYDRISAPDSGFTYNAVTGDEPKKGYVLSIYPDRETVLDAKTMKPEDLATFIVKNRDLLSQQDRYFGGWNDPKSGKVYLDVSVVLQDKAEAARLAKEKKQLAFFDLGSMESVRVEGRESNAKR
jgi:hypothetical protein